MIPKVYNGKNKTFFFIDNEYLKKNQAGAITLSGFPTDAERNGDFSQSMYGFKQYPIYDPFGPQVYNTTRGLWKRTGLLGGDGKHVPASLISPVSKKILAMAPKANRAPMSGSSSTNNYAWSSSQQPEQLSLWGASGPQHIGYAAPQHPLADLLFGSGCLAHRGQSDVAEHRGPKATVESMPT